MAENVTSVKVALRIRPLIASEISRGCKDVIDVFPELNQVKIGEKAFTYNYVYGTQSSQDEFYNSCTKSLVDYLFKGYNVTILAYGQTGSGKTHSMGTAYSGEGDMGVIPRSINDIFNFVKDNFGYDFSISVSFMELYQEVLYDLLSEKGRENSTVEIREDNKSILIPNLTEVPVKSTSETLHCLSKGSQRRAVGSTNMNSQSSRSHAIFTVNICMQKKDNPSLNKTAKFHLVDLAGSERSKKTGATGQTFKEGVNINRGLLALGNVISALGDEKTPSYISYRDSNLTRLLKDSLGGNSITLMIACVSPADYNYEETISTLRYADRARKIKNKPVVNEDPKTAEINRLKKLVDQLRMELVGQGGPIICQAELELLKKENTDLKNKNRDLNVRLSSTLNEKAVLYERLMIIQSNNENLQDKLKKLHEDFNETIGHINSSIGNNDMGAIRENVDKLQHIQTYLVEIDSDNKKNQNEIMDHERANTSSLSAKKFLGDHELTEDQESHTEQQYKLNNQLQEVIKGLAMKEHLVEQMSKNAMHIVDYKEKAETEEKIATLEKELHILQQQLKNTHSTEPSNKLAEQRRKRVQELESQIHSLNKKVNELQRLIKMKEKDEQRIKQLNNEITQMKQMKVKLIRTMRQESENFRVWKMSKERDLLKLKEQDRKREFQMKKMQMMHDRQKNVFKRKMEEGAATIKRLKDGLALSKAAREKNTFKIDKIGNWIKNELDVHVSALDARLKLNELIEDRAAMMDQVEKMRGDPEHQNSTQVVELEREINIISIQIGNLQQKLLDLEEDDKTKSRWENIQTMSEAKFSLNCLFNFVADIRKRENSVEHQLQNMEHAKLEREQQIEELMQKIEMHDERLAEMQKENEEKITVLLTQLQRREAENPEEGIVKRMEIEKNIIANMQMEIEKKKEEIAKLKQALDNANKSSESDTYLTVKTDKPSDTENDEASFRTPQQTRFRKNTSKTSIESLVIPETPIVDNDNPVLDPDWRNTPLGKRVSQCQQKTSTTLLGTKRSSEGGCSCKTSCRSKLCGCRKFQKECTSSCRCNASLCVNEKAKNTDLQQKSNPDIIEDSEDEELPIKKPRIPLMKIENAPVEDKVKKTRKLYS